MFEVMSKVVHSILAVSLFLAVNIIVASIFVVPPVVAVAGGLYVTRWVMGH